MISQNRRFLWPAVGLVIACGGVLFLTSSSFTLSLEQLPEFPFVSTSSTLSEPCKPSVHRKIDEYGVDRGQRPSHPASHGALKEWGHRVSFKDNLRDDRRYLISFVTAGWNNQVIAIMNLIHLAYLSGRIPILPPYESTGWHQSEHGVELNVGDVFDLSAISAALGLPVVEYTELKATRGQPSNHTAEELERLRNEAMLGTGGSHDGMVHAEAPEMEDLGCWSYWRGNDGSARIFPEHLGISLQTTPIAQEIYAYNDYPRVITPDFAYILQSMGNDFVRPEGSQALMDKFSIEEPTLNPENHVACIDHSYFFVSQAGYNPPQEITRSGPSWGKVGIAMRFHPKWLDKAEDCLRQIFSLGRGEDIPPYVAVHIRRGDFSDDWHALTPRDYAYAAQQVQVMLRERTGVEARHVLVTTNEQDEGWRALFDAYEGIYVVSHDKLGTTAENPVWSPTVLDSIFLSSGMGLVGSKYSTMSILAERRVVEWRGGVGLLIGPELRAPEGWDYPLAEGSLER